MLQMLKCAHQAVHPLLQPDSRLGLGAAGVQQSVLHLDKHQLIGRQRDAVKVVLASGVEALVAGPVALLPPVHPLIPTGCKEGSVAAFFYLRKQAGDALLCLHAVATSQTVELMVRTRATAT